MKSRLFIFLLISIAASAQAVAQSPANRAWVGIWHAHADGQPTDTLTLATDTGELGGTIVLDMIRDEAGTPDVIARDPHLLMNPHLNGNTLSFRVRMTMRDGRAVIRNFAVTLTSPGKANIHCINCGPRAPAVPMTRDR